jgi:predicted esterase
MPSETSETFAIPARVHGHAILVVGSAAGPGAPLLVGFHGYGENAELHLAELARIPGVERFARAAVQALHPFYTRRDEVVANWMTRFDRERAIADNVDYVAAAVARLQAAVPGGAGPLVYAGFSQGVAMAYRAAALAGHACAGVIALSGDVPPELAPSDLARLPPVVLGRGRAEAWYDEAKMAEDVRRLRTAGAAVRPVLFDGGHEWTDAFRAAAGEFLAEVCP